MMHKYFDKNKKEMFPWIKDWNDPQDHLRNETNVKKLSQSEWFYFHPTAYNLLTIGGTCISLPMFGVVVGIGLYYKMMLLTIFGLVFCVFLGVDLFKKIKNYKYTKDMNFYDLWMREQ